MSTADRVIRWSTALVVVEVAAVTAVASSYARLRSGAGAW